MRSRTIYEILCFNKVENKTTIVFGYTKHCNNCKEKFVISVLMNISNNLKVLTCN